MEKVILKHFTSDVSEPSSYDLDNPDSFSIEVMFWVGTEGSDGEELFRLYVCSPDSLAILCRDGSSHTGRGLLIMNEYREMEVRIFLERIIQNSQRETWDEVVLALMRYAYWAEE